MKVGEGLTVTVTLGEGVRLTDGIIGGTEVVVNRGANVAGFVQLFNNPNNTTIMFR